MVQMEWYQCISANYDIHNYIYVYFALNYKNVKYNDSVEKEVSGYKKKRKIVGALISSFRLV